MPDPDAGRCPRVSGLPGVVYSRAQAHIALDAADSLEAIATALAPRPDRDPIVCFDQDGLSRSLNDAEQRELDERLRALRR